jgi:beta-phosphoglucomutase-like phosphatase (HAD superfamily)
LNKKGIRDFFEDIVSGDDVKKGKPDPETWDKCSKLLNIPYKECLVLEDGKSGLIAAKALGMKTIALLPEAYFNDKKEYLLYPADYYTYDFSKVAFLRNSFTILVN